MLALCEECDDVLRNNVLALGLPTIPDVPLEDGTLVEYSPFAVAKNMVLARALEGLGMLALIPDVPCLIHFLDDQRDKEEGRCLCTEPDCDRSEPWSIPPFRAWLEHGENSALVKVQEHMRKQGWVS